MTGSRKTFRQLFIVFLTGLWALSIPAFGGDLDDSPFQPSDDLMGDVDRVLERAREGDKLALIIMGANWCHDSMGLYDHFQDPEMAAILARNYEMVFVDVGYLEHGKEVIQRFGQPVIYGTPTVLIIDPLTEELLNRESMHRLRESATMDLEEARHYFADLAAAPVAEVEIAPSDPKLRALYDEIKAFEDQQASRIYRGFAVIGPLLDEAENGEESDTFRPLWRELADLRYQITDDLVALRAEARRRVAAGEEIIELDYPVYEKFSWED